MTDSQPHNRAQRRAAARKDEASDIKFAQPDRSGPKGKTLLQLAEERRALLAKGQPFPKAADPGKPEKSDDSDFMFGEDPIGPVGEALLYTTTLSMLHFTLDVLVYNQYRQEVAWREIFLRLARMAPVLFLIIYMLHSRTVSRFPVLKQLFFAAVCVSAGSYMIYSGNHYGYFAVMKRAPPVGTLWIWSVVEMQLVYAVVSLALVGIYVWFSGLKPF